MNPIVSTLDMYSQYSKGYLDIVRWLCEHGGAAKHVDGVPGVDVRSNGGWTPLSTFIKEYNDTMLTENSERCLEGSPACGAISTHKTVC